MNQNKYYVVICVKPVRPFKIPNGLPIISTQLIPMSAKISWATGPVSFTMNREIVTYPSGKAILGKFSSSFKKKKKKQKK